MKKLSYRLDNLELRSCPPGDRLEIVQWSCNTETYCWTSAYWETNKDDIHSLCFVSDRPFHRAVDWKDFEKLAQCGQDYLDKELNDSN